jgi:hypothetical protein
VAERVALVTYPGPPDLSPADGFLASAREALGMTPTPVVWQDASVALAGFDLGILRSTWDYHLHLDTFLT